MFLSQRSPVAAFSADPFPPDGGFSIVLDSSALAQRSGTATRFAPIWPEQLIRVDWQRPTPKFKSYTGDVRAVFSTAGGPSTTTFTPNAEFYSQQWHLSAIGNLGKTGTLERIWAEYRGKGVRVGVYDEGMDASHVGLAPNYNAALELPNVSGSNKGVHGTAVAGLIAGSIAGGAVGVAFEASLTSIPLLAKTNGAPSTRATFDWMAKFDVVNCSWGPIYRFGFGNGLFDDILASAMREGRKGLGTIVVNSAGNSYSRDGYTNSFNQSRYSISVGALTANGDVTNFSTRGASVLVSAPGAGLTTTDVTGSDGYTTGDYFSEFSGTSGAAPIVSGVVALMLSANPLLGWRDVQEILALTANHTTSSPLGGDPAVSPWVINGARNVNGGGLHFSNDVGYGQVDAYEAVRMAEVWGKFTQPQTSFNEQKLTATASLSEKSDKKWSYTFTITSAIRLEHADLTFGLFNSNPNIKPKHSDLEIELVSASGTISKLSDYLPAAPGIEQPDFWTYGSEAFRGELSAGTWTLRVSSKSGFDAGASATASLALDGSTAGKNDVYHFTDEFWKMLALDPGRATLTDTNGGTDWIDAAAITGNLNLDLNAGATSTWDGRSFITIGNRSYIESAVAGDGNDTLTGTWQGNNLCGMRGNDRLDGGDGNDRLEGGADNDTLLGGNGNDTLDGGPGHDHMFGGTGNDVFRFTRSSVVSGSTAIIEDFYRGEDFIDLSGLGLTFNMLRISEAMDTVGNARVSCLVVEFSSGALLLRNVTDLSAEDFRF